MTSLCVLAQDFDPETLGLCARNVALNCGVAGGLMAGRGRWSDDDDGEGGGDECAAIHVRALDWKQPEPLLGLMGAAAAAAAGASAGHGPHAVDGGTIEPSRPVARPAPPTQQQQGVGSQEVAGGGDHKWRTGVDAALLRRCGPFWLGFTACVGRCVVWLDTEFRHRPGGVAEGWRSSWRLMCCTTMLPRWHW
jgi:hypothetical protein